MLFRKNGTATDAAEAPPPSAASDPINFVGILCFIGAMHVCRYWHYAGVGAAIAVTAAYALPILLLEVIFLRTPWRASAGLDFSRFNFSRQRYITRMVGLAGSFGFLALLYWMFPEYHGDFYNPYWEGLGTLLPFVFVAAFPYMALMDGWLKKPEDSYYWFGRVLLGDWDNVNWRMMGQHLLGWLVKGFFLPLMFVYFVGDVNNLVNFNPSDMFTSAERLLHVSMDVLFTFDLLGAIAGYTLALRLFDTHIRSAEPTLFGWIICVICYQPFQSTVMRYYFADMGGEFAWAGWLAPYPALAMAWAVVCAVLLFFYIFCSLNFGCRFSNLTHRGILTNGLYRVSKHPAYLSKNLFWWMTSVPFVPLHGWSEALRYSMLLACVSTVYFLRARTEERHLSHDPVYVKYALWMNEYGIFSILGKKIPFFRYKAPAGWENLQNPYEGIK